MTNDDSSHEGDLHCWVSFIDGTFLIINRRGDFDAGHLQKPVCEQLIW